MKPERLTKKVNEEQALSNFPKGEVPTGVLKELKLSKLEDLEEDLGIDLITLCKAIRDGICLKDKHYVLTHYHIDIMVDEKCFFWFGNYYYFKDYGKTWALTAEELKND